jgi:PKD repeat protein
VTETHNTNSRTRIAAALVAAAVGAATLAATAGGVAGAAPPARAPGAPAQVLEERMHGEAAIRALGAKLPAVAKANGLRASELARRLRVDPQLWVAESGTLLFVDEGLAGHTGEHIDEATATATAPAWSDHSPADAFSLHSRPGADRVVYLDFDGHATPGSAWSGTPGAPYDTDGKPSTFSDAERRAIIDVWRHVSEDFAPFAIDVTTADPGIEAIRRSTSSDAAYGTRVVITPTKTDCDSCGGIAYVGTYDFTGSSHDKYQPAWVYIAGTNAKSIAEAASHEAGHNLGLYHDAVVDGPGYYAGHGDWAPIMGVGYYKAVTQWSRGEYAGGTNTEDDFTVIAQNGGTPAGDDHGGTASTATPLDTVVDVVGEIGTRSDVDALSFTTSGGALSLAAAPATVGANLDISLRLVRDTGSVVTTVDPAGLSAALDTTLVAGTYTVLVDGVGAGDPATDGYSDYASVGRYRLTGSLPSGETVENRAPAASFTSSTTSGPAPLLVSFDGSKSSDPDGDALTHSWTIDGTTQTGATASHTFETPGSYAVTLTVSDGQLSDTASTTITVSEPKTVVSAPTAPTLAASAASGTVTLDWNDADGVVSYVVYRETRHKNGSYRNRTQIGTVEGTVSTWVDKPGSGTFRYQVVARNSAGSASSNHATASVGSTSTKTTGKGAAKGPMKTR